MSRLAWAAIALIAATPASARTCSWQASWASAQMLPDAKNAPPAGALDDATLRQVVRPSLGGTRLRVRFSNAFGRTPLRIGAASVARADDHATPRLAPGSVTSLTFGGARGVVVPAGGEWLSDPVTLALPAFADLAISVHLPVAPEATTGHPGSRASSWIAPGAHVADLDLPAATRTDHWYLLAGVEVRRCATPGGIVVLGDSITDGYGVTANSNARWTDVLARRLGGRVAVLNAGIGGNRLLADGLGPNALARLDRDVLGQAGARRLIVLEGVNDLGTLTIDRPADAAAHRALVTGIIGAYAQIVARARSHGMRVHLATVTPFGGSGYYHPDAANEADRQAINAWIRSPGHADGVIDFDRLLRDPARPDRLLPAYDSGDGLHPNIAGYRAMGEAIPLATLR